MDEIKIVRKVIRIGNSPGVTISRNILNAMGFNPERDDLELNIKKKRRLI